MVSERIPRKISYNIFLHLWQKEIENYVSRDANHTSEYGNYLDVLYFVGALLL
jgi:hypothetical protein